MKKLTQLITEKVQVKHQNLNSELIYIMEGNAQVGSLILIYNEKLASIFSVEVLSCHRGKGYGKKLVENAVNRCKEKGCFSIELNTEFENNIANNLYTSMGFGLKGTKDNFNNYLKVLD